VVAYEGTRQRRVGKGHLIRRHSLPPAGRSSDCRAAGSRTAHASLPPTVLWLVEALLEWGMVEEARVRLDYWFRRFVRDDGTFDYYGPSVAEYGQMLSLVCKVAQRHSGEQWLDGRWAKVDAITGYLLHLRAESLAQPEGAVARGLLYGAPEADTRDDRQYYFHGTAWVWRGLRDLVALLDDHPALPGDADALREASDAMLADLRRAAAACLSDGDAPSVPPYPGAEAPPDPVTADGTPATYDANAEAVRLPLGRHTVHLQYSDARRQL